MMFELFNYINSKKNIEGKEKRQVWNLIILIYISYNKQGVFVNTKSNNEIIRQYSLNVFNDRSKEELKEFLVKSFKCYEESSIINIDDSRVNKNPEKLITCLLDQRDKAGNLITEEQKLEYKKMWIETNERGRKELTIESLKEMYKIIKTRKNNEIEKIKKEKTEIEKTENEMEVIKEKIEKTESEIQLIEEMIKKVETTFKEENSEKVEIGYYVIEKSKNIVAENPLITILIKSIKKLNIFDFNTFSIITKYFSNSAQTNNLHENDIRTRTKIGKIASVELISELLKIDWKELLWIIEKYGRESSSSNYKNWIIKREQDIKELGNDKWKNNITEYNYINLSCLIWKLKTKYEEKLGIKINNIKEKEILEKEIELVSTKEELNLILETLDIYTTIEMILNILEGISKNYIKPRIKMDLNKGWKDNIENKIEGERIESEMIEYEKIKVWNEEKKHLELNLEQMINLTDLYPNNMIVNSNKNSIISLILEELNLEIDNKLDIEKIIDKEEWEGNIEDDLDEEDLQIYYKNRPPIGLPLRQEIEDWVIEKNMKFKKTYKEKEEWKKIQKMLIEETKIIERKDSVKFSIIIWPLISFSERLELTNWNKVAPQEKIPNKVRKRNKKLKEKAEKEIEALIKEKKIKGLKAVNKEDRIIEQEDRLKTIDKQINEYINNKKFKEILKEVEKVKIENLEQTPKSERLLNKQDIYEWEIEANYNNYFRINDKLSKILFKSINKGTINKWKVNKEEYTYIEEIKPTTWNLLMYQNSENKIVNLMVTTEKVNYNLNEKIESKWGNWSKNRLNNYFNKLKIHMIKEENKRRYIELMKIMKYFTTDWIRYNYKYECNEIIYNKIQEQMQKNRKGNKLTIFPWDITNEYSESPEIVNFAYLKTKEIGESKLDYSLVSSKYNFKKVFWNHEKSYWDEKVVIKWGEIFIKRNIIYWNNDDSTKNSINIYEYWLNLIRKILWNHPNRLKKEEILNRINLIFNPNKSKLLKKKEDDYEVPKLRNMSWVTLTILNWLTKWIVKHWKLNIVTLDMDALKAKFITKQRFKWLTGWKKEWDNFFFLNRKDFNNEVKARSEKDNNIMNEELIKETLKNNQNNILKKWVIYNDLKFGYLETINIINKEREYWNWPYNEDKEDELREKEDNFLEDFKNLNDEKSFTPINKKWFEINNKITSLEKIKWDHIFPKEIEMDKKNKRNEDAQGLEYGNLNTPIKTKWNEFLRHELKKIDKLSTEFDKNTYKKIVKLNSWFSKLSKRISINQNWDILEEYESQVFKITRELGKKMSEGVKKAEREALSKSPYLSYVDGLSEIKEYIKKPSGNEIKKLVKDARSGLLEDQIWLAEEIETKKRDIERGVAETQSEKVHRIMLKKEHWRQYEEDQERIKMEKIDRAEELREKEKLINKVKKNKKNRENRKKDGDEWIKEISVEEKIEKNIAWMNITVEEKEISDKLRSLANIKVNIFKLISKLDRFPYIGFEWSLILTPITWIYIKRNNLGTEENPLLKMFIKDMEMAEDIRAYNSNRKIGKETEVIIKTINEIIVNLKKLEVEYKKSKKENLEKEFVELIKIISELLLLEKTEDKLEKLFNLDMKLIKEDTLEVIMNLDWIEKTNNKLDKVLTKGKGKTDLEEIKNRLSKNYIGTKYNLKSNNRLDKKIIKYIQDIKKSLLVIDTDTYRKKLWKTFDEMDEEKERENKSYHPEINNKWLEENIYERKTERHHTYLFMNLNKENIEFWIIENQIYELYSTKKKKYSYIRWDKEINGEIENVEIKTNLNIFKYLIWKMDKKNILNQRKEKWRSVSIKRQEKFSKWSKETLRSVKDRRKNLIKNGEDKSIEISEGKKLCGIYGENEFSNIIEKESKPYIYSIIDLDKKESLNKNNNLINIYETIRDLTVEVLKEIIKNNPKSEEEIKYLIEELETLDWKKNPGNKLIKILKYETQKNSEIDLNLKEVEDWLDKLKEMKKKIKKTKIETIGKWKLNKYGGLLINKNRMDKVSKEQKLAMLNIKENKENKINYLEYKEIIEYKKKWLFWYIKNKKE